MSGARILALKARAAILKEFPGEGGYRNVFSSVVVNGSRFADQTAFGELIEDLLSVNLTNSDISGVYALFDVDGDGKVSQTDFLNFVIGQSAEAFQALDEGDGDAIIDIRISTNSVNDIDLGNMGFEQLKPSDVKPDAGYQGTFGRSQSMWIWRRKQGTCSGRLKPIIDIQLDSSSTSSALVISGYICIPVSLSGQWVWIKRAGDIEEEKDAIIDLCVTHGHMKNPSDPIWSGPGMGWIRVDGNFSRGIFSPFDCFLWFHPFRSRSLESHLSSPIRMAVALSEETKLSKILVAVRLALRHYVPLEIIHKLAKLQLESDGTTGNASSKVEGKSRGDIIFDFAALYHQYDSSRRGRLSFSQLQRIFQDIGLRLDKPDVIRMFRFFNIKQDSYISREEYSQFLALTDYELDLVADHIRNKLLSAANHQEKSSSSKPKGPSNNASVVESGASKSCGVIFNPVVIVKGKNKLRENRTLAQVFDLINEKKDGILSVDELIDLCGKLNVFIDEEEAFKLLRMMDIDGDDRVEESDFIKFMKKDSEAISKRAHRVRDAADIVRRWLIRGCNTNPNTSPFSFLTSPASTIGYNSASRQNGSISHSFSSNPKLTDNQWIEIRNRHESLGGNRFPGFLIPEDLYMIISSMGLRMSLLECRQLALLIAPERSGRIHREDLQMFITRSARTFGELIAILQRDHLKVLFDSYKKYRNSVKSDGVEDTELLEIFHNVVAEITRTVQTVSLPSSMTPVHNERHQSSSSHEVVSLLQLKTGIESLLSRNGSNSVSFSSINLEEWAGLVCLVGSDVAEEDTYGVNIQVFLSGIISYVMGSLHSDGQSEMTIDYLCIELQRMIRDEAISGRKNGIPDFHAVFNLFDQNASGTVTIDEFQFMLNRLKLLDALPESQVTLLMSRFDKKNQGKITFEDFIAFIDEYQKKDPLNGGTDKAAGCNDEEADFAEDDDDAFFDEDGSEAIFSSVPPNSITKNSDCDWLLWHIWRQCSKKRPQDPESVVTDLETSCSEMELVHQHNGVTASELWMILSDLRLVGNMARAQYDKSIKYLLMDAVDDKSEGEVDYDALCRYCVRMGRNFQDQMVEKSKVDEEKYQLMKSKLKKEFISSIVAGSSTSKYEKILRRFDTDGDGKITMAEFKRGLKKLNYVDRNGWTRRMVRRLFHEMDSNRDNVVSIKELSQFLTKESNDSLPLVTSAALPPPTSVAPSTTVKKDDALVAKIDIDSIDDSIFNQNKHLDEKAVSRKIAEILLESIASKGEFSSPLKHLDAVKASIRRFFHKHDSDTVGIVSDEIYKMFLRKSGLQDQLTLREVRFLTEKIRRKRNLSIGSSKSSSFLIDYEKLIDFISMPADSIAHSKSESSLKLLQDAMLSAASSGRPFISLCALLDSRRSGFISISEFLVVCKMMDCILSLEDVEGIKDILPSGIIRASDGALDYEKLNDFLPRYTPRMEWHDNSYNNSWENILRPSSSRSNGLTFGTPGRNGITGLSSTQNTPLPFPDRTQQFRSQMTPLDLNFSARGGGNQLITQNGFGDKTISSNSSVFDRIRQYIQEKSRNTGHSFNFSRHLESFGGNSRGYIHYRNFQQALDDIGLFLSAADFASILSTFTQPDDPDYVDFDSLVRRVGAASYDTYAANSTATNNNTLGSFSSRPSLNTIPTRTIINPKTLHSTTNGASDMVSYSNGRVLSRLKELQLERRDPRDLFEAHDLDRTGMVTARVFRDVIQRTQLLQTESQLNKALEDFAVLNDRNMILYEDFCQSLEALLQRRSDDNEIRSSNMPRVVNGSGFDGFSSGRKSDLGEEVVSESTERWFRDDFSNDYFNRGNPSDNWSSEGASKLRTSPAWENAMDLDEGTTRPLGPPKVSESFTWSRNGSKLSNTRYGSGDDVLFGTQQRSSLSGFTSPPRSSIAPPRASPSRVGSKIWGSDTPMSKKGLPPKLDDGCWCCPVCLYMENPKSAKKCQVCDSPNYAESKEFQLKEQCSNCTFINGMFAEDCAMCGESLGKKKY